jgi:hypothetical protein
MKLIPLTQDKFAQVDDSDFEYLNQWKWYADKHGNTYYARRDSYNKGKRESIYMHCLIMNPSEGIEPDHMDHNGLNCQRHNMRNCTRHQNTMNTTATGISKYLGVGVCSTGVNKGHITAQIHKNGKKIHLGNFKTEESAALAYDTKARELFGEFANLNFK